jgi:hypothetical protein
MYNGDILDGEKHGVGCYHCARFQCQYVGTFGKGAFLSGRWLFRDGSYVEGVFVPGTGKDSYVPIGDAVCMFERPGIQQAGKFQDHMKWVAKGF